MPAASQHNPQITFWKLLVVSACVCVFLFALQAKLAQYETTPSVTPVKAAKLWDGEHRLQLPSLTEISTLPLLALPLLFVWTLCDQGRPQFTMAATPDPPLRLQLWHVRRFFRPPPAL